MRKTQHNKKSADDMNRVFIEKKVKMSIII